jgi:hypothetical protein
MSAAGTTRTLADAVACPQRAEADIVLTDAVEKVVDDFTKPFRWSILGLFLSRSSFLFWRCWRVKRGVQLLWVGRH